MTDLDRLYEHALNFALLCEHDGLAIQEISVQLVPYNQKGIASSGSVTNKRTGHTAVVFVNARPKVTP